MKRTKIGSDLIKISEIDLQKNHQKQKDKVHIIFLDFKTPNIEKVDLVLSRYPDTNRYIISDNIKFYNGILRNTNKKYYIINKEGDNLISFFKRNNKVLLDITKLSDFERIFVLNVAFQDVLRNTEVIIMKEEDYEDKSQMFMDWRGNLAVYDPNYII